MDYMQIVEEGNIDTLKEIHDIITTQLPYRLVAGPETGKVAVSHTDPQEKVVTHTGETVATFCEVEVDGNPGYGCVPGNDPERAKYAALIDSVIWNEHPMSSLINPLLDKIENELLQIWKKRREELYV